MKIGILTHYYGSNNYGGVLQAYALTKVLRDMGYDAEQICFPFYESRPLDNGCSVDEEAKKEIKPLPVLQKRRCLPLRILTKIYRKVRWYAVDRKRVNAENQRQQTIIQNYFTPRRQSFSDFRNRIPHSSVKYSNNTLFMANESYDAFITGSDQVWNLQWHTNSFFLEFADVDKKKIAYAASAGASEFDEIQKKYLKRVLPKYDAISVRESDLVDIYRNISGIEAEYVLDPTLLLDKEDWDEITSKRLVPEKYLLCFFYNPTESTYELAKQYAQKYDLKIATISYAHFDLSTRIDDNFGDYKIGNASPNDFISLVKYAECVFTDSYHCNVFSIIYDKPFYVFKRQVEGIESNSRIESLTKIFECNERCCDDEKKKSIEYIDSISNRKYTKKHYYTMRDRSVDFLSKSLENEYGG